MQPSHKVSFFNPEGRSKLSQFKSHSSLNFQRDQNNTESGFQEGDWSIGQSQNIGTSRTSDLRIDPNSSEERLFKIRKQKQSLERDTDMLTNRIKILQNEEKKMLMKIKDTRNKVDKLMQIRHDKDSFYEQKLRMEIDYEKEIANKRLNFANIWAFNFKYLLFHFFYMKRSTK